VALTSNSGIEKNIKPLLGSIENKGKVAKWLLTYYPRAEKQKG
jgi:hypothetical protein